MHSLSLLRNNLAQRGSALISNTSQAIAKMGDLRGAMRLMARKWNRRKMNAMLEAMDDHLLNDIGIARHQIARLVDGLDDRELRMVPIATHRKTPGDDMIWTGQYGRAFLH